MMPMVVPPGYTRVRILKRPVTYARELLAPGAVVVLDDATAHRLVGEHKVELVPEAPAVPMVQTSCPKCGAAMEYPADPAPEARWTQCHNPACGHGWLR